MTDGAARIRGTLCWVVLALFLPLFLPAMAWAQTDDGGSAAAEADSVRANSSAPPQSGLGQVTQQADQMQQDGGFTPDGTGPRIISFTNAATAGARANVRQNTYYGELISTLKMRSQSTFTNTLEWSFEEYRKQNKNAERRSEKFVYSLPQTLPMRMQLRGNWGWSRDKTVNTANFANLFAQQNKDLSLSGSRLKVKKAGLVNSFNFRGKVNDNRSESQATANNSRGSEFDAGLQSGWEITPGLVLAGRVHAMTGQGEKTLGTTDSPASTFGDTLGVGLYYNQNFSNGRVAVTRSNFERKYLDFKKNSNGLIDTVGVSEAEKVVNELESKDAMTIELTSNFDLGPLKFEGAATRTTDDLNYDISGQGLKERQVDKVELLSGIRVGADSLSVGYEYGWKWDDQRIQGATTNRGRQYNKGRDVEIVWLRPLFKATNFRLRYHQGLSQDIAQFEHNQNDKDRLQNDFSVQVDRNWQNKFRTKMVYIYRQTQDVSIRDTRSSNNNIKDSYDVTPSYTWYVARWLTWDQSYRVYIQFTDYVFSQLESVSRDDNYNKRSNLTTKVTLYPTSRLDIILRHDFNKKFNATKGGTDASGSVFYNRDLNQTIGKLDLAMTFRVISGVTMEAATYRTKDNRETLGRVNSISDEYSGELWVGTKVNKTWRESITLSALVKKFNAFGPSVSETSANYWEADVWLKWEF